MQMQHNLPIHCELWLMNCRVTANCGHGHASKKDADPIIPYLAAVVLSLQPSTATSALKNTAKIVELTWQGKFRGISFDPMYWRSKL